VAGCLKKIYKARNKAKCQAENAALTPYTWEISVLTINHILIYKVKSTQNIFKNNGYYLIFLNNNHKFCYKYHLNRTYNRNE
jgi:hypothetical protein